MLKYLASIPTLRDCPSQCLDKDSLCTVCGRSESTHDLCKEHVLKSPRTAACICSYIMVFRALQLRIYSTIRSTGVYGVSDKMQSQYFQKKSARRYPQLSVNFRAIRKTTAPSTRTDTGQEVLYSRCHILWVAWTQSTWHTSNV